MTKEEKRNREEIATNLSGPPMAGVLSDFGITDAYLASKLSKELKAKKTTVVSVTKKTKSGKKKKLFITRRDVDWDVRQKARMDAHKLLGHYPAVKQQLTITPTEADPVDLEKYKNPPKE